MRTTDQAILRPFALTARTLAAFLTSIARVIAPVYRSMIHGRGGNRLSDLDDRLLEDIGLFEDESGEWDGAGDRIRRERRSREIDRTTILFVMGNSGR